MNDERTITVPILARVEGEGALHIAIAGGAITQLHLSIFDPPRLFEKFLEGRSYTDVLDLVARICGICPVAYQMTAAHALESIFNINPGPWVRAMRRAFYCGEWIESHSVHIHLLAIPDFYGYDSAMQMAKDHPEIIRRGLRLQAAGNEIIKLFGARSVHPVGACVGGFSHAPSLDNVAALVTKLKLALLDAEQLLRFLATIPQHNNTHEFVCVALQHPDEYPMNTGRIVSDHGLDISAAEFEQHFHESQVAHSNALHCSLNNRSYLVGPLARVNINFAKLPQEVQNFVNELGFVFPSKNMFASIVARGIEIYFALFEAIKILQNYTLPLAAAAAITPAAGTGFSATEAPRGLLWKSYATDADGLITNVNIIPPTSQNQRRIEEDLRLSLTNFGLKHSDAELRAHAEMLIRNYDPCISCATHFLDLRVERA